MTNLTVAEITPLTEKITEILLQAADGSPLPEWTAGAHVVCKTAKGERSYSLICWPESGAYGYRIAVQREDAGQGGSKAMHELGVGDRIATSTPSNDFDLVEQQRPVALLAGGIGVTPLISMATALDAQGRDFVFHYAGRSASVMAYRQELQEAFGSRLILHYDDETPLDLPRLMGTLTGYSLYICGPKGMIEAARAAAEAAGIAPDFIHVELFTTAAPEIGAAAFEVEIASSGQVVPIAADKSIIEALEEAGLDVMYDCQRGDCGICQTEVISGTPDHRDVVLSQAERDSGKVMQICVSRALSKRLVLDL